MNVDPTADELRRLASTDRDGPFVMLNLLKFPDADRPAYAEYAQRAAPFLERYGAEVLYAGDCDQALVAPAEHDWDSVLLVRYPSRAAFLEMIADPGYREITALRSAGLQSAVLQPTIPWR